MGLKFYDNNGGEMMYFCGNCWVYLADRATRVSDNFTGITGQAYLFKQVQNVSFGPLAHREMMTGAHYVRDVFCISCNEKLGWMYELAPTKSEEYKEGSVILERMHIIEIDGDIMWRQINCPPDQLHPTLIRRPTDVLNDHVMRQRQQQRLQTEQRIFRNYPDEPEYRFRFDGDRAPTAVLHNEGVLRESLGLENYQMESFRMSLRRLNLGMLRSAEGSNDELWMLGFRVVFGRQNPEISAMMDGDVYHASEAGDRNLYTLFSQMSEERRRMRRPIGEEEEDEVENEVVRGQVQLPPVVSRHVTVRGPLHRIRSRREAEQFIRNGLETLRQGQMDPDRQRAFNAVLEHVNANP